MMGVAGFLVGGLAEGLTAGVGFVFGIFLTATCGGGFGVAPASGGGCGVLELAVSLFVELFDTEFV